MNIIKKTVWPIKIGLLCGRAAKSERQGKPGEAIDCYIKAFRYCTEEVTKASLVEDISNVYWRMGKHEEALKYARGAQAFYERHANEHQHYQEANERLLGNIAGIEAAFQPLEEKAE